MPERREDEDADAEQQRHDHRAGDGPVRHLLLAFLALGGHARRVVQRAHAEDQRLDQDDRAAEDRELEERILRRDRDELVLLDGDVAVRLAHGDRVAGQRAHHHALDHGLAADEHVDVAVSRRGRHGRGQAVRHRAEGTGDQLSPLRATPSERTLFCRGFFRAGLLGVALLEAVDAAGRVDQLLLAGEERMALRADLDAQLFLGRAGRPRRRRRSAPGPDDISGESLVSWHWSFLSVLAGKPAV